MSTLQLPCSSHEVVDTEINGQMPVGLWSGQEGRGENDSTIAKPRKGESVSKMSAEESSIFFQVGVASILSDRSSSFFIDIQPDIQITSMNNGRGLHVGTERDKILEDPKNNEMT